MTDSTGITERTYDEENRVLTKTVPGIGTITYQYDILEADGYYSEISTDPKNNVTKKVFDKVGRLKQVIEGVNATTFEYYASGNRQSVIYPDNSREDYTYYKDGLLKNLVNTKGDSTVLDSYSYTYDGAHNQTTKTDNKGLTKYEYDSLNRLSKVTEPSGKVTSYIYDKAGNRIQETVLQNNTSTTTTYSYNEQNRLTDTVTRSGFVNEKVKYEYDNNGNTLIKVKETTRPVDPEISGGFAFKKAGTSTTREVSFMDYDVWNQMIKTIDGDKTLKYMYNGEGYRVEKSVNDQITRYMYEADKVILEVDGLGNATAKNTYGTGILSRTTGSETAYYMYNGHGDVTALLSATGIVMATYYYDAFGNPLETTGEADNPFRYAGYQYDEETGVYYLNARYYDPKIARFLSEDTYMGEANDPLSLNLYTYVANNPIKYWDPTGYRQETGMDGSGAPPPKPTPPKPPGKGSLGDPTNPDPPKPTPPKPQPPKPTPPPAQPQKPTNNPNSGTQPSSGAGGRGSNSGNNTNGGYEEPDNRQNSDDDDRDNDSGNSTKGTGETSPSTTDHNTGEWTSTTVGLALTYDTAYNSAKYNLLTPAQKNATLANGKPSSYWVKNNPASAAANNVKSIADVGKATKGAFTKGNVALAGVGIALDTYDDVSQLRASGADDATIDAAIATDVGFGAVGSGLSLGAGAAAGALAGTAFCPVVGTIIGAGVGIGTSLLWDYGTSGIKKNARDSLANHIR